MDNLDLWERHADVDPRYTKAIVGKGYKGTSPSPQYVIRCLTDMFGPVGKGFGWDVTAEGWQPLGDEVLHWCRIRFWHTDRANGFDAYGQTMALMSTKNGLKADEDAPKKSLTDAIVKAASQIGVAANIFLGRWDDQKYVAEVNAEYREAEKPGASPAEVASAVENINAAATLEALQATFGGYYRNARHVADHPMVVAAKDQRKLQLTQAKDAA